MVGLEDHMRRDPVPITESPERVDDPVAHISISGIHGRDELNDRLATATPQSAPRRGNASSVGMLLLAAAAGAAFMYLFKPARGR
jgi:hypothetical protein